MFILTAVFATTFLAAGSFAAVPPDPKSETKPDDAAKAMPEGQFERDPIRRNGGSGGAVPGTPRSSGGTSGSSEIGRVLIGLTVVILLFLAMVTLGKKVAPGAVGTQASGALKVLLKSPVAPRQQLMLVQVGRRIVLVGNGGGEMNPLCQIEDPGEVAALLAQIEEDKSASPRNFLAMFGKANAKYTPSPEVDDEEDGDEEAEMRRASTDEDLGGIAARIQGIKKQFQK